MDINNKKLLCALSVIALVVIIIQLNDAFGSNSNLEGNDNSMVEDIKNNNLDNTVKNLNQNQTKSMNINTNNQFFTGSDITIYEGETRSLSH